LTINLLTKFGAGITPEQFMSGMNKNKEQFMEWYNSFAWENEEDRVFFQSLKNRTDLRCFILAAEWCGDVVRNVPVVLQALAETGMPVEILIMEENLEVMDQFLTMGGRAIPVVIFTDANGVVKGKWGPRPKHVQAVMISFKQQNPDREAPDYQEKIAVARQEMLKQYGTGTGYQTVIVKELREVLSTLV